MYSLFVCPGTLEVQLVPALNLGIYVALGARIFFLDTFLASP